MFKRHLLLTVSALLVLTACNKQKDSPEEAAVHIKAAQGLFAQQDYAHALVEVKTAIKASPRSGDAHYLAAQINEALGDGKSAFEEYARASAPEANNLPAQLKVVQILIGANQLDTALGRINGTLGSRPNEPDALALRALIEQRQGKADKARGDAQAALTRQPGQAMATSVLASEALNQKSADKALTIIEPGLKAHPGDISLTQLKAAAFLMQDDKEKAVDLYEQLVKVDPKVPSVVAALAELKASTGDVDGGEAVLRAGTAAAPASNDMRIALIGYLGRHRDGAAVEKELRSAIAEKPTESTYDLMLAQQLARTQRADEAVAILKTAIERVPVGPAQSAAQIALARLSVERGDDDLARKELDDAIKAKPDNDDALLLRAGLMAQFDDTANAISDLLAVASRRPTSPIPLGLLADAYVKQGDLDKAVDALKKVVYFQPTNLAPVSQLVAVYLKQTKPDLAKQALADFVKRNPTSLEGRVMQLRLSVQLKDWSGAQANLDQMRTVPKSDRLIALLSAELNEARGMPSAAATAFKKILDASGGEALDRDALTGFARSSVAAKQTDDAIAVVSSLASSAKGTDATALNLMLAALLRSAGQDDKAADALKAAIAADPKQPDGYLETAADAVRQKQPDHAIEVLNQGLWAGAPKERLLMARASLEDTTGKKDDAIESYQEVIKLNPRSVVAANNYASLVADAKPQDTALLTDARKPIQRFVNSRNPAMLDTLAWLDYRLGDFQKAKDLLLRAQADKSDNAQLRFHYGAVLMALGDKDNGRSMVKAALNQPFPGHAEAERLLTE